MRVWKGKTKWGEKESACRLRIESQCYRRVGGKKKRMKLKKGREKKKVSKREGENDVLWKCVNAIAVLKHVNPLWMLSVSAFKVQWSFWNRTFIWHAPSLRCGMQEKNCHVYNFERRRVTASGADGGGLLPSCGGACKRNLSCCAVILQ